MAERYWQKEIETASREEIKAIQDERLVKTIKHVYANVEMYRQRMDEAGISPDDIKGVEDLHKLPFTTKQDLRDYYPYGLFAVPQKDVVRLHASSGTTGKQIVVGYTKHDLDVWDEIAARQLYAVGADENDFIRFAILGGYREEERRLVGLKTWRKKTKESIGECSAIGNHLAEMIHKKLGVAVGVISCYKGASIIQAWTNKDIVVNSQYYIPPKDRHLNYEAWGDWNGDGFLYENIFKKMGCYGVSNVVWYQGESNTNEKEGAVYLHLLEELIADWRNVLRNENLPFTIVEIHNYFYREDEGWYSIQRAQKQADKLPFVSVVENEDSDEPKEIHPSDKYIISKRIFEAMRY
jgi:hypothetical protein